MKYSKKIKRQAIEILRIACLNQQPVTFVGRALEFDHEATSLAYAMFMNLPERSDSDTYMLRGEAAQLLVEGYLPDDEFEAYW